MPSVQDALVKYIHAKDEGGATDDVRLELATAIDTLFKEVQKVRLPFDLKWYFNQRFIDGDQNLEFDRKNEGKITNSEPTKKRVTRTINLIKPQIRAIKNSVLKTPLVAECSPEDDSDDAIQQAQAASKVLRGIEYDLKLKELRRPIAHDGFVKSAGFLALLPTSDGGLKAAQYDRFDVYEDPTAPSLQDGQILFLATRQNLQAIKANKDYENTADLHGDSRLAASEFKDSLERSRQGGKETSQDGDLASVIWGQLFIKFPYTHQPVTMPDGKPMIVRDGQPKMTLQPSDEPRIWIVTFTEKEIHRCEETNFKRFTPTPYYPEKSGNRVLLPAWVEDMIQVNKSINALISTGETWHRKATPKLLVPTDSKIKEITNLPAEVLEYDKRVGADAIKDFMPQGLPQSFFAMIDLARAFLADIGGMHETSLGSKPMGVTAAKALEALRAADLEMNIAEPTENWALFWQEVYERILEHVAENQLTQRSITYPDDEKTEKVNFIGQAGLVGPDGAEKPAPEGVTVIKPSRVRVTAEPEIAYTEGGKKDTVVELYDKGVLPRDYVLKQYRVSNIPEVAEKARQEQLEKAQNPTPPPPVPADKILNALANLTKSGEPITIEQLNAAMQQAGLPPFDPSQILPTAEEPPQIDDSAEAAA